MYKCNKCGTNLVVGTNWYKSSKDTQRYICNNCQRIYNREYRQSKGEKPMSENKECPLYLGVHIAERVLSKVFYDVERMSVRNPGFDFICNRGKKIDVKSACSITNIHCTDIWHFTIKKNKIPDYFLCLAFDNRDSLTPLHMWLIPGNVLNKFTGITIGSTNLGRWDEYLIGVEKVAKCCNELRMA